MLGKIGEVGRKGKASGGHKDRHEHMSFLAFVTACPEADYSSFPESCD